MNLSAVILTKNEENNIKKAIESVSFVDEIVVIDDNSKDKTVEIAKGLGCVVFSRSVANDFAAQRNYGLTKASGKWVLFIDADEIVTPKLKAEIIQTVNNPFVQKEGFLITRQDVIFGKNLRRGEFGNSKLLRLALRTQGSWYRAVHEKWLVNGRVGKLKGKIRHYPHENLNKFVENINLFSTLHALANKREGKKASIWKIVFYPGIKFIDNSILKHGFLDGMPGFMAAMMMSFHSFLSWSKLWVIQSGKK